MSRDMAESSASRRRRYPVAKVKGGWTPAEDECLKQLVEQHCEGNWSIIARALNAAMGKTEATGRIGKQCRERWNHHLRPGIRHDAWTEEEESQLVAAHMRYGNRWSDIARCIPGRTENSCKNHWNATRRRRNGNGGALPTTLKNYMQRINLLPPTSASGDEHDDDDEGADHFAATAMTQLAAGNASQQPSKPASGQDMPQAPENSNRNTNNTPNAINNSHLTFSHVQAPGQQGSSMLPFAAIPGALPPGLAGFPVMPLQDLAFFQQQLGQIHTMPPATGLLPVRALDTGLTAKQCDDATAAADRAVANQLALEAFMKLQRPAAATMQAGAGAEAASTQPQLIDAVDAPAPATQLPSAHQLLSMQQFISQQQQQQFMLMQLAASQGHVDAVTVLPTPVDIKLSLQKQPADPAPAMNPSHGVSAAQQPQAQQPQQRPLPTTAGDDNFLSQQHHSDSADFKAAAAVGGAALPCVRKRSRDDLLMSALTKESGGGHHQAHHQHHRHNAMDYEDSDASVPSSCRRFVDKDQSQGSSENEETLIHAPANVRTNVAGPTTTAENTTDSSNATVVFARRRRSARHMTFSASHASAVLDHLTKACYAPTSSDAPEATHLPAFMDAFSQQSPEHISPMLPPVSLSATRRSSSPRSSGGSAQAHDSSAAAGTGSHQAAHHHGHGQPAGRSRLQASSSTLPPVAAHANMSANKKSRMSRSSAAGASGFARSGGSKSAKGSGRLSGHGSGAEDGGNDTVKIHEVILGEGPVLQTRKSSRRSGKRTSSDISNAATPDVSMSVAEAKEEVGVDDEDLQIAEAMLSLQAMAGGNGTATHGMCDEAAHPAPGPHFTSSKRTHDTVVFNEIKLEERKGPQRDTAATDGQSAKHTTQHDCNAQPDNGAHGTHILQGAGRPSEADVKPPQPTSTTSAQVAVTAPIRTGVMNLEPIPAPTHVENSPSKRMNGTGMAHADANTKHDLPSSSSSPGSPHIMTAKALMAGNSMMRTVTSPALNASYALPGSPCSGMTGAAAATTAMGESGQQHQSVAAMPLKMMRVNGGGGPAFVPPTLPPANMMALPGFMSMQPPVSMIR